jgi:predicted nuclease of predicted toxin-antitoxin system
VKFVIDMNLSPRWAAFLRQAGFEASHWSEIGAAAAPDGEVLAHARANGLVLVTHDLDFSAILAASGGIAPSVVQIRGADLEPDTLGQRLVAALRKAEDAFASGAVLSIDVKRARLRALPLR